MQRKELAFLINTLVNKYVAKNRLRATTLEINAHYSKKSII